ncbi:MAG: OsmC family protein [Caldisericia bacterium]|jgi:putative redox protein|nr:OsmC family protein [Caldisericia bacterium]
MQHFELNWIEKMRFEGETHSKHKITLDASEDVGGENKGPRPMELFIIGLMGCTAMDVISILTKMKKHVKSFKIEVDATKAETHPKVWTDINLKYILEGEDLDEKSVETAIELSQNKYCSAAATLKKSGAKVNYSYEIKK